VRFLACVVYLCFVSPKKNYFFSGCLAKTCLSAIKGIKQKNQNVQEKFKTVRAGRPKNKKQNYSKFKASSRK